METKLVLFSGVPLVIPVIFGTPMEFAKPSFCDYPSKCGAGVGIGDIIVPETMYGLSVSPACDIHDAMWDIAEPSWIEFHQSNSIFLSNILSIIHHRSSSITLEHLRNYRAVTYYNTVNTIGSKIFWKLKKEQGELLELDIIERFNVQEPKLGAEMKFSEEGLRFIEMLESKSYEVYPDSSGLPTTGIGHLLTKDDNDCGYITAKAADNSLYLIRFNRKLTDQEVYDILRMDIAIAEYAVRDYVTVPLYQNQYDALVSFVFNIGVSAFKKSTLLRVLNDGEFDKVPEQMKRWKLSKGKEVQGLINRRQKEIELWTRISHS
jgi:lysozyme